MPEGEIYRLPLDDRVGIYGGLLHDRGKDI